MPSPYNGLSSNVTAPPATVNIVSSTNATPIEITSAAHGLTTGDAVIIAGHATNTAANGIWGAIVKVSATKFTLTGSVGNGVGGATGTVQSLAVGATFDICADGDAFDAATIAGVMGEALGDRTAFLWKWIATRTPSPWEITDAADADGTYDTFYFEHRIPDALGAGRTYTLRTSTGSPLPTNGKRLRFSRTGTLLTNAVTFKREDATTIASIAAGTPAWVEFVFRSSDSQWHVSAWGGNTTVSAVV